MDTKEEKLCLCIKLTDCVAVKTQAYKDQIAVLKTGCLADQTIAEDKTLALDQYVADQSLALGMNLVAVQSLALGMSLVAGKDVAVQNFVGHNALRLSIVATDATLMGWTMIVFANLFQEEQRLL